MYAFWWLRRKEEGLPEDTPWNHGVSAIMETELGWYTTGIGEDQKKGKYDVFDYKYIIKGIIC